MGAAAVPRRVRRAALSAEGKKEKKSLLNKLAYAKRKAHETAETISNLKEKVNEKDGEVAEYKALAKKQKQYLEKVIKSVPKPVSVICFVLVQLS